MVWSDLGLNPGLPGPLATTQPTRRMIRYYIYIYIYIYICVCVCVCVHLCLCVYTRCLSKKVVKPKQSFSDRNEQRIKLSFSSKINLFDFLYSYIIEFSSDWFSQPPKLETPSLFILSYVILYDFCILSLFTFPCFVL